MNPQLRVVVSAYNQSYVDKLARKVRRIAVSRGTLQFSTDRNAASEWELAAGGGLLAVGIGGGLTGNPAELAIIDDPIKGREDAESEIHREKVWEWYVDELSTRIQQNGQKLLVLTPWHEDDLRGRILNSAEAKRWTVVKLPAICESNSDPLGREIGEPLCPERRNLEWLLEQKMLGERSFQALYQCDPTPREGSFFSGRAIDREYPLGRATHGALVSSMGFGLVTRKRRLYRGSAHGNRRTRPVLDRRCRAGPMESGRTE